MIHFSFNHILCVYMDVFTTKIISYKSYGIYFNKYIKQGVAYSEFLPPTVPSGVVVGDG